MKIEIRFLCLVVITIANMLEFIVSKPLSSLIKSNQAFSNDFIIGVDCGSSHSKAIIYQLIREEMGYIVQQLESCETDMGIDKYQTPDEAAKSILNCVEKLLNGKEIQPFELVRVYVGATAGMRLLNRTDPVKVQLIFEEIRFFLNTAGNLQATADIISGQNEALYAWLTVNYYNQKLQEQRPTNGIFEIGGASKQIGYPLNDGDPYGTRFNMFGVDYSLYLDSDLCTGMNSAFVRYLYTQIKKYYVEDVLIGCLPRGYSITTSRISINDVCSGKDEWIKYSTFNFIGTGNYSNCLEMVKIIVSPEKCKQRFDADLCPHKVGSIREDVIFYALSVYYYMAERFDLIDSNGHVKLEQFVEMNT